MNVYVSLIIRNHDGRFLTLHCHKKKEYHWRFPAGKVEPGETLIAAAARELKEETGIDALSLFFHSRRVSEMDGKTWVGYYFVCVGYYGTAHIQEPEKHNKLAWLSHIDLVLAGAHENEMDITRSLELGEYPPAKFSLPESETDKDLWAV